MSLPQSKPACKIKLSNGADHRTAAAFCSVYVFIKSNKEICLFNFFFHNTLTPCASNLPLPPLSLAEELILIVMISFDVTLPGAIATNGWSVSLPGRKSSR